MPRSNDLDTALIAADIQFGNGINVIAKIHFAQQIGVTDDLLDRLAEFDVDEFSQVKAAFETATKNALSPEEAEAVAHFLDQVIKKRDEISRIKQYQLHVTNWD